MSKSREPLVSYAGRAAKPAASAGAGEPRCAACNRPTRNWDPTTARRETNELRRRLYPDDDRSIVERIADIALKRNHPTPVGQPHIRRGWLENGPGAADRGDDPFVPVPWDVALDLLADELRRVYRPNVYGGSARDPQCRGATRPREPLARLLELGAVQPVRPGHARIAAAFARFDLPRGNRGVEVTVPLSARALSCGCCRALGDAGVSG